MMAVFTKYLGPTNTRGSRIKAGNRIDGYVIVPYNCALSPYQNHEEAAREFCKRKNLDPGRLNGGEGQFGYVFLRTPKEEYERLYQKNSRQRGNGKEVPNQID